MQNQNTKTPVMVLQELTTSQGLAPPDYNIVFQKSGTHENQFDFVVTVAGVQARGSGSSKQIGKHQAAHNALIKLQELGLYNPSDNPVGAFKVSLEGNELNTYKIPLNCIATLQNICIDNKIGAPEFYEISSVGPPHSKEFTFECKISSITTEAKASTKKMAKQFAAQKMLERIKEVLPDLIILQQKDVKELTDKDTAAMEAYNDLREIIPDKSVKMDEITHTLAKIMYFKNLKYDDFKEDLQSPSEDNLRKILERLEVGYIIEEFQVNPPIAALVLKIDTPFTVLSMGKTLNEAKFEVLLKTFNVMDIHMQIQI